MEREKGGDEDRVPLTEEEQQILLEVIDRLRKLRFGTVQLVVQDGKVVQIETAEKVRLR